MLKTLHLFGFYLPIIGCATFQRAPAFALFHFLCFSFVCGFFDLHRISMYGVARRRACTDRRASYFLFMASYDYHVRYKTWLFDFNLLFVLLFCVLSTLNRFKREEGRKIQHIYLENTLSLQLVSWKLKTADTYRTYQCIKKKQNLGEYFTTKQQTWKIKKTKTLVHHDTYDITTPSITKPPFLLPKKIFFVNNNNTPHVQQQHYPWYSLPY